MLLCSLQLDGMTKDEMNAVLRRFAIKSPTTGNDLSDAIEFNLMFSTCIGPSGLVKGYVPRWFQIATLLVDTVWYSFHIDNASSINKVLLSCYNRSLRPFDFCPGLTRR